MWWPLTTVASAALLSPFMAMILSAIFLKEFATYEQVGFLLMTLIGAIVMIFYTPESEEESLRIAALGSASVLAYVLLFLNPFVGAAGAVLMRKLRKLSNMTVSCYFNLSGICVYPILCLCIGYDLTTF